MGTPLEQLKKLKDAAGVTNLKKLFVLSRDNDPFGCGTPTHIKGAEWFAESWHKGHCTGRNIA